MSTIKLLYYILIGVGFTFANPIKTITLELNNFIAINGPINKENVNTWIRNISSIDRSSFYIYINSNGGSVEYGLQLINQFNYLRSIGKTIDCIAQNAYSMAFQILQSCDKRYITSSSKVMQHQMSLGNIDGPFDNIMNYINMIQQMSNDMDKKVSDRIGLSFEEYKRKTSTDWWLYGEDIIKANVADEIVYIGCSPKLYNDYQIKENTELFFDQYGELNYKTTKVKKDICPL